MEFSRNCALLKRFIEELFVVYQIMYFTLVVTKRYNRNNVITVFITQETVFAKEANFLH